MFANIGVADLEDITRLTGCMKPCQYRKYQFVGAGEHMPSKSQYYPDSEYYAFSLWAVSGKTTIRTEKLIYPPASLVADFGGTLGLFLGFSFVTVFEKIQTFGKAYKKIFHKRSLDLENDLGYSGN